MQTTFDEIVSQPAVWRAAAGLAVRCRAAVPDGERVAFIGCGTSWFVAQAVASLRESLGFGESDAFAASEAPLDRHYDRVVAISRSGNTTEVVRALSGLPRDLPTVAVVAVTAGPVLDAAAQTIALDFADEQSVVQTRFATAVIAMFRAAYGHDIASVAAEAELLLGPAPTLVDLGVNPGALACRRFVFLGHGWTVGLAHEAALKLREAALAATESYPAMEYRHGPIALAEPGTAVWWLGADEAELVDEVAALGATVVHEHTDPLVSLVAIHLLALGLATRDGLDPDTPRNLSRSVVLEPAGGAR
jgi:fructoselysine-6-P-deglycase FrlB-like protein